MTYKFDNQKLITCGIEQTLPPSVTMLLWQLVMAHVYQSGYERRDVDYLQVFKLSANTATLMLTVKHTQEQPKYEKSHQYMLRNEDVLEQLDGLTIFVIDDITHCTMLISTEY